MNVRTLCTLLVLTLLLGVTPLSAQETFDFEYGNVSLTVPANWNHSIEGNVLTVESPDKKLYLTFETISPEELDKATEQLGSELTATFPDIKLDELEESVINGMEIVSVGGVCEGGTKYAEIDLIVTKNGKVLVATSTMDFSVKEKYKIDLDHLYESITPIK